MVKNGKFWKIVFSFFFQKNIPLGVILCGESIARIPGAI
jgi:hypothetical protein